MVSESGLGKILVGIMVRLRLEFGKVGASMRVGVGIRVVKSLGCNRDLRKLGLRMELGLELGL